MWLKLDLNRKMTKFKYRINLTKIDQYIIGKIRH